MADIKEPIVQDDSIRAAKRVDTGFGDRVEATAIEIAARAYKMNPIEGLVYNMTDHVLDGGSAPGDKIDKSKPYDARERAARIEVTSYLESQTRTAVSVNGDSRVDTLVNAGQRVAAERSR